MNDTAQFFYAMQFSQKMFGQHSVQHSVQQLMFQRRNSITIAKEISYLNAAHK